MASKNTVVKWPLLAETVNQIKVRYVDKISYAEEMSKKINISDFETTPIDWDNEYK